MNLSEYSSILLVMDEGIGNMLDMTPAIRVLKEMQPGLAIDVLGRYPALDIVSGTEYVRDVFVKTPDREYDIGFFAIWYNYTVKDMRQEITSKCKEMFLLSYNTPDRPEWWHYLEIPRLFGWRGSVADGFCAVEDVDIEMSDSQLTIGLADTAAAASQNKRWPYYAELAHTLTKQGCEVVLLGSQLEAEEFQVDKWPESVVNLLGKFTIPQTAGIIKKCDLVIGNDCGLAQMAAVLNVPTIFIYGPTYVPKNYPLVPAGNIVKIVRRDLDCAPCQFTDRWAKCTDWQCMKSIRVQDVIAAIVEWQKEAYDG